MGKKSPKKVAKVSTCPETIKKALAGIVDSDEQGKPVFKELNSGNYVMSKEAFEMFQTPKVKKQLKAVFTEDGELSPKDTTKIDVEAARHQLALKRNVKRQDERASKILSKLSTSNPVQSARCLADIEKALAGSLTPDYPSMFEIARDKGNESVSNLVDDPSYAARDAAAWRAFAIKVMQKLHGGENYLYRLGTSAEHMGCRQRGMTVSEYADMYGPNLTAILKAYDREGIKGRERTAVESSFTAHWIKGLEEDLQSDLLRSHTSSIHKGNPMSFESIHEEALVNEQCRPQSRTSDERNRNREERTNKRTASGAAAVTVPQQPTVDEKGTVAPPAVLAAINAADKKLSTTVAAMQAVLNKIPQVVAGTAPDRSKGGATVICFFCQRKGLDCNHNHLTCPIRLSNKRARDGEQSTPHFLHQLQHVQPPPGPPLMPPPMPPPPHLVNPAYGRGCYRCGDSGHRSFECSGACKTCRQVGKGQHLPNCPNKPKPFSGNGGGGRGGGRR